MLSGKSQWWQWWLGEGGMTTEKQHSRGLLRAGNVLQIAKLPEEGITWVLSLCKKFAKLFIYDLDIFLYACYTQRNSSLKKKIYSWLLFFSHLTSRLSTFPIGFNSKFIQNLAISPPPSCSSCLYRQHVLVYFRILYLAFHFSPCSP